MKEAKLIKDYSFWKKDQKFGYKDWFGRKQIFLKHKDNYWYMMASLTIEEFNKNLIDLQEERKKKILKIYDNRH